MKMVEVEAKQHLTALTIGPSHHTIVIRLPYGWSIIPKLCLPATHLTISMATGMTDIHVGDQSI